MLAFAKLSAGRWALSVVPLRSWPVVGSCIATTTTLSATGFSQDKVFVGALKVLPLALFDAMEQAELLDPGLLTSYSRSLWKDLKTPRRTDVEWRTSASSSAVSPPISSSVSSTVSLSFPGFFIRYSMCEGPGCCGTGGTCVGVCGGSSSLCPFLSFQRLGQNRLKRLRMDALPRVFRWKIVLLAVVKFLLLCHFGR